MNPKEVNRINYNNYYVGQNLDFLVRSKMRSESLTTPLKNTPPFYDDQVTSKMSLLGKRGYYDPGYIYGFSENPNNNPEDNQNSIENNKNRINEEYSNPILTREQYDYIILPKEQQILRDYEANNNQKNNYQNYNIKRNINNTIKDNINNNINYNINNNSINDNLNYNKINNNINRNNNNYNDEKLYNERIKMLRERQTPQKLDNFQLERTIKNNQRNLEEEQNNINNINNMEQRRNEDGPNYEYNLNEEKEYYEQIRRNNNGMMRNQDKIPNKDYYKEISEYNYINELAKKNVGDLVLPLTKNQILQGVLTENFNKKNYSK